MIKKRKRAHLCMKLRVWMRQYGVIIKRSRLAKTRQGFAKTIAPAIRAIYAPNKKSDQSLDLSRLAIRTLAQVGKEMGVTGERVRQIEASALKKLKRGFSANTGIRTLEEMTSAEVRPPVASVRSHDSGLINFTQVASTLKSKDLPWVSKYMMEFGGYETSGLNPKVRAARVANWRQGETRRLIVTALLKKIEGKDGG